MANRMQKFYDNFVRVGLLGSCKTAKKIALYTYTCISETFRRAFRDGNRAKIIVTIE